MALWASEPRTDVLQSSTSVLEGAQVLQSSTCATEVSEHVWVFIEDPHVRTSHTCAKGHSRPFAHVCSLAPKAKLLAHGAKAKGLCDVAFCGASVGSTAECSLAPKTEGFWCNELRPQAKPKRLCQRPQRAGQGTLPRGLLRHRGKGAHQRNVTQLRW